MKNVLGTDVSRWQHPVDGELGYSNGIRFAAIRGTIGDYYTDSALAAMWKAYKDQGCLVSAYLVTAPKDPTKTRDISASAHLDLFANSLAGYKPDFQWIIDAELDRGASNSQITKLQKDVAIGLYNMYDQWPMIYTRQTWWDQYTYADPVWSNCDLFAARYNQELTGPWSDGHCIFRDWKEWVMWQKTNKASGKTYGWSSLQGDLDDFNGDIMDLYLWAGLKPPSEYLSYEDKVDILWREAQKAGWNLER